MNVYNPRGDPSAFCVHHDEFLSIIKLELGSRTPKMAYALDETLVQQNVSMDNIRAVLPPSPNLCVLDEQGVSGALLEPVGLFACVKVLGRPRLDMELPTASYDGGCMWWWLDAMASEEESSVVLGEGEENEEKSREEQDSQVVHCWTERWFVTVHRWLSGPTLVAEGGVGWRNEIHMGPVMQIWQSNVIDFHSFDMAPKHNDRMDIDSDSDISIDFEHTTSKGKGKGRAKAGDKRKADKGKGKAKDTVRRFRLKVCDSVTNEGHSKRIPGKPHLRVHGTLCKRTRRGVCKPLSRIY